MPIMVISHECLIPFHMLDCRRFSNYKI
uniref:Uncharacterized protein n=1 Tax=Tetranychus urticae TaxID=32264 RepID=T1KKB7_TETUR